MDRLGVLMGAGHKMFGQMFPHLLRAGSRGPIRKIVLLRAGSYAQSAEKQKSRKHTFHWHPISFHQIYVFSDGAILNIGAYRCLYNWKLFIF
jgi:hypothetical protein